MVEKGRALIIMVIEWILFLIGLIAVIVMAVLVGKAVPTFDKNKTSYAYPGYTRPSQNQEDTAKDFLKIILIIVGVFMLIGLLLNILLTIGVLKEHVTCCKIWYIVSIIGIVFQGLGLIAAFVTLNFVAIIVNLINLGYKIFAVKTIMEFTNDVAAQIERGRDGQLYTPVHH